MSQLLTTPDYIYTIKTKDMVVRKLAWSIILQKYKDYAKGDRYILGKEILL